MAQLPSAATLGSTSTAYTAAVAREDFLDWLAVTGQIFGATATCAETIASGAIAPTSGIVVVETEGLAATDRLDTISPANLHDNAVICITPNNSSRVVTVHHSTATNGINTIDGADHTLAYGHWLMLRHDPGTGLWKVMAFSGTREDIDHRLGVIGYILSGVDRLTTGTAATYSAAGLRAIRVRGCGAGGGGGGVDGQGSGTAGASLAGAGGSYFDVFVPAPSDDWTYTIGAAGVGGPSGANSGTDGGTTSFSDGTITMSAPGGPGGGGVTATSGSAASTGSNTTRATGTGATGPLLGKGTPATARRWTGGTVTAFSTSGCCPVYGGGITCTNNGHATTATTPGEGGGAAAVNDSTSNYSGGDGQRGEIHIERYV